jgi:hypothetical protein
VDALRLSTLRDFPPRPSTSLRLCGELLKVCIM